MKDKIDKFNKCKVQCENKTYPYFIRNVTSTTI